MINLKKAKMIMDNEGLDAIIVSSPENLYYTSGLPTYPGARNRGFFTGARFNLGYAFVVIIKNSDPVLICNYAISGIARKLSRIKDIRYSSTGTYIEKTEQEDIVNIFASSLDALHDVIKERNLEKSKIGIEKQFFPVLLFEKFQDLFPCATFANTQKIFEDLRKIKSLSEIEKIKKATVATQKALKAAIEIIHEGIPEREILKTLQTTLFQLGCDWNTTTVGAGVNGAEVYNIASDYILKKGDIIRFDVGGTFEGYASDLSRMVVIGAPSDRGRKIFDAVYKAEEKVINAMRPGVKIADLYRLGIETVRNADFPHFKRGSVGHSIGLQTHEFPDIGPGTEEVLQPGMIFAIEHAFYVPNFAGFNVEDLVLVTSTGHEVLSTLLSNELCIK